MQKTISFQQRRTYYNIYPICSSTLLISSYKAIMADTRITLNTWAIFIQFYITIMHQAWSHEMKIESCTFVDPAAIDHWGTVFRVRITFFYNIFGWVFHIYKCWSDVVWSIVHFIKRRLHSSLCLFCHFRSSRSEIFYCFCRLGCHFRSCGFIWHLLVSVSEQLPCLYRWLSRHPVWWQRLFTLHCHWNRPNQVSHFSHLCLKLMSMMLICVCIRL